MNLLYLSEDYFGSKVHHNLVSTIKNENPDYEITLYTTLREWEFESNNLHFDQNNYTVIKHNLANDIRWRFRTDFDFKIRYKLEFLEKSVNFDSCDFVHAATLFSDGALAYRIHKKYNKPYSVCVRGTDVFFYLKYMVHLWPLGIKIINNASKIIFITNNIKDKFNSHILLRPFIKNTEYKQTVIPNGIDQYWLNNISDQTKYSHNILYIGRFDKNKNVIALIDAVIELSHEVPDIHLTLVGGGDIQHEQVISLCQKYPSIIEYKGKIFDLDKLKDIVRENSIYAMVSHTETFGLVYIEALSQGLKVLYTKGQGIDGMFTKNIGERVSSHNKQEITIGLKKLLTEPERYENVSDELNNFSWTKIAQKYTSIYNSILNRL